MSKPEQIAIKMQTAQNLRWKKMEPAEALRRRMDQIPISHCP